MFGEHYSITIVIFQQYRRNTYKKEPTIYLHFKWLRPCKEYNFKAYSLHAL